MRRVLLHTLAALLPTVVLAATAAAPAPAVAPPGSAPECEALAALKLADTTISSSKAVAAGPFTPPGGRGGRGSADLPAFCQVHGVLKPTPHSTIHFEVWLPAAN